MLDGQSDSVRILSLSKPMVNRKLSPRTSLRPQRPLQTATSLLSTSLLLPISRLLPIFGYINQIRFSRFPLLVYHWEGLQERDDVRTNFPLRGGSRATVEIQRLSVDLQKRPSTERSRHSLKYCSSQTSESRCPRLTSPVVPEIQFLGSHRHLEKKEYRGEEDHVEHIAVELELGHQNALVVVHRRGDLGP